MPAASPWKGWSPRCSTPLPLGGTATGVTPLIPLELQLFTFLAFVLLGMAIGLLFDLLRL